MFQLQAYRLGRGLSPGDIAERSGLSHNAIANFENQGTTALRALSFDQLSGLAAIYGIALTDLLDWLRSEPTGAHVRPDPEDAAKVQAALADADEAIDRDGLAISLQWTLERTQAALDALIDTLRGNGQAIARTSCGHYRLIPRPGVLTHDEQLRLRAARGRADRNLTVPEATVLRVLLDQPTMSATHAMFTDPKERDAVAALLRAGTLLEFDHVLSIHEDAAFSLFNRYRPPQSVVSPSCHEAVSSR